MTLESHWRCRGIEFIASGGGIGFAPIAPGTFGTLLGLVIYRFVAGWPFGFYLIFLILIIVLSVWISNMAEKIYQKKDPSCIIIDEISGYLTAMVLIPYRLEYALLGFCISRILDIIKPYPAGYYQSYPGGWGIVSDDIIAGIYTGVILYLYVWLISI